MSGVTSGPRGPVDNEGALCIVIVHNFNKNHQVIIILILRHYYNIIAIGSIGYGNSYYSA
jgi:hypothetical protein